MRILHVSDFHFHRPWFDWTTTQAEKFDAVAFTGDFIEATKPPTVTAQIDWVKKWMQDFPGRLLVCSGNHDDRPFDVPPARRGWLNHGSHGSVLSDGGKAEIESWHFESVPWLGQPTRGGSNAITLQHCPPQGTKTAISHPESVDFGDFDLAENLLISYNAPYLLLGGHVHRPRHWIARVGKTWSFNPGMEESRVRDIPNYIVVDLNRGLAIRHTSRGEERAFLG